MEELDSFFRHWIGREDGILLGTMDLADLQ